MKRILFIIYVLSISSFCFAQPNAAEKNYFHDGFLDSVQQATFDYFWECVDPATGLTPDRYPTLTFSSTAAIGFALTAYCIGSERGYVSRDAAAKRVLTTLNTLWNVRQGKEPMDVSGYKGFFYHFLRLKDGTRFAKDVELSSIDTGLLMAGVLCVQSYFDKDNPAEQSIRSLSDSLYRRVEWTWMQPRMPLIAMGWYPDRGFHHLDWRGFDESSLMYFLALGSPTHPVSPDAWKAFTGNFQMANTFGYDHIDFDVIFWNQYTLCWYDMRGINDSYSQKMGMDYFENARRAAYVSREHVIANPGKFQGYSSLMWGLSACDGPADTELEIDGVKRRFFTYGARGYSSRFASDDGTLTPTAPGGSVAIAPEICVPTLKAMKTQIPGLWTKYGFLDAFNQTYITEKTPAGWVDHDYLGLDQGPIIIMIENLRSGFVWKVMQKNPYVVKGLRRAGFQGGWLNNSSKNK